MSRLWQRLRAAWNASPVRRRPRPLNLESLEDRTVPTGVTYHGGPVLQNAQIEPVYYGTAWNSNATLEQQVQQVNGFLNYFGTSPSVSILSQYGVGAATYLGDDVVNQNPAGGATMSDSQIRTALNAEITAGHVPAPNANSLYVFFTAPGVTVTANGQSSGVEFAGYHDTFQASNGATVYYAVVPYPVGSVINTPLTTFQDDTYVLSHEISESMTDPDTQTGWFDAQGDEIADLGEGTYGTLDNGRYVVTGVWSNAANQVVVPSDSTTPTTPTTPSPTVTVTGDPVQAVAGQSFTSVVATISGASASAAAGYTATISWGDGTSSAATLAPDGSNYDVTGTHTYTGAGWYAVTVTVKDATGAVVGSSLSRATVTPPPPTVTIKGTVLSATAGTAFTGTVASFTDVRSNAAAGDFTATINWGDGTSSTGTVVADGSGFDVTGTHTYANSSTTPPVFGGFGFGFTNPWHGGTPGNQFYVLTITVTDNPASATAVGQSLARVAPIPPSITARGQNLQAASGVAFTGTVATFTSTDSTATAATFTATITWGDGTTSTGTVAADPTVAGQYDVTGTHTYTLPTYRGGFPWFAFNPPPSRNYIVGVSITDTSNSTTVNAESLATVTAQPVVLTVTANNIQTTSGTAFTGTVAKFTDTTATTSTTFTATINWGDGSSSAGTVTADPNGGYDVTGTHTYTLQAPTPVWGSPGLGFGHSATSFGLGGAAYIFSVTVSDSASHTATSQAVASVAPAPPTLQAYGTSFNAVVGTAFTGTVASFTSLDTSAQASDFTVTINWGDGTSSAGTVSANSSGSGFVVTGTHTYSSASTTDATSLKAPNFGEDDSFVVTVSIQNTSDNSMATTASLATVTTTPASLVATAVPVSATAGTAFTGTVATFTDADGSGVSNFTATISWGDGRTSQGTVAANTSGSGFTVTGTHTYATAGTFTVLVNIHDNDGDEAVSLGTATVATGPTASGLTTAGFGILQSTEYYTGLILNYYQMYLGRAASAGEIAPWVNYLQHGGNDNQVLAGFLGSTEFYQHVGNNPTAYVKALYTDLLGRAADSAGLSGWVQQVNAGASKSNIVMGFTTSTERDTMLAQSYYHQYLGRTAGAGELSYWVNQLQHGATDTQIQVGFLSSQEYLQKQGGTAANWITSTYMRVLDRPADQGGESYWLGVLDA